MVLERAEWFCKAEVITTEGEKGKIPLKKVTVLRGRKALQHLFGSYEAKVVAGKVPDFDGTQPFKTFRWMLADKERETFKKWMVAAAANKCGHLSGSLAIGGGKASDGSDGAACCAAEIVPYSSASSSSGSAACAAASLTEPALVTGAYQKKKADSLDAKNHDMLQFFKAPSKRAKHA